MEWTCGTRNAYRALVGNHEGTSSFGRPSCRWGYIIQTVLKEIERKNLDWIDLAQEGTSSGLW